MTGLDEWGGIGPYRDGKVHVCADMCATCVFRPGNLMRLSAGRLRGMVAESLADDTAITCHATLAHNLTDRAVCRVFFDRHAADVLPLRAAVAFDLVEMIDPPAKERT